MTIVESIKCVLQQNNDGLTSKQIYDEIIRQGLYLAETIFLTYIQIKRLLSLPISDEEAKKERIMMG